MVRTMGSVIVSSAVDGGRVKPDPEKLGRSIATLAGGARSTLVVSRFSAKIALCQ